MRIDELMTRVVHCCEPKDSLKLAAQKMWDGDCGSLVVADKNERAIAMITDRDICMAAFTQEVSLDRLRVSGASSHELYFAHAGDTVESVAALMTEHRVRRIPVLDADGHPIGIVSMNDLIRTGSPSRGVDFPQSAAGGNPTQNVANATAEA